MSHILRCNRFVLCEREPYASHVLTGALPAFVSFAGQGKLSGAIVENVTARVDLPPISASLTGYIRSPVTRREMGTARMSYATVKAAKTTDNQRESSEQPALHRRYGQIGISAVAAAARYQGGAKNPAYAPVAIKVDAVTAAFG
jgi:hypothetical protein